MDIILTQHGRKLLSQGKLIVKYYRFFDDEIDYQVPNISLELETDPNSILTEAGEELITEDGSILVFE